MMAATAYRALPLTLALSPLAGRGDTPLAVAAVEQDGAAYPFSPPAGRRWRQPDEGQAPVSAAEGKPAPVNVSSQEAR
ncbi:hypothetical protein AU381_08405 [Sinorhizobium glycinis]|uniref:Uncharacterized protein n=1 Tax=Sinorhizobium glycinis TaxID=1472378 RepID=A0A178XVC0_9HYPH|nr:hypothetical protein AU381_08405 [Sinorhizobium glycinis]